MTRPDSLNMPPKRSKKVRLGINISQSRSRAVIQGGTRINSSLLSFTVVRLRLAFIYRCSLAVSVHLPLFDCR